MILIDQFLWPFDKHRVPLNGQLFDSLSSHNSQLPLECSSFNFTIRASSNIGKHHISHAITVDTSCCGASHHGWTIKFWLKPRQREWVPQCLLPCQDFWILKLFHVKAHFISSPPRGFAKGGLPTLNLTAFFHKPHNLLAQPQTSLFP